MLAINYYNITDHMDGLKPRFFLQKNKVFTWFFRFSKF